MEFEGQYLTYQEYKALGGSFDLVPFNLLEFESRRQIDIRTQNRLKNVNSNESPQEVKLCVFSLINSISGYASSKKSVETNGNVASESTDGYSVSYVTANQISEVVKSKQVEIDDIIRTYLVGVIYNKQHLMYAGVE